MRHSSYKVARWQKLLLTLAFNFIGISTVICDCQINCIANLDIGLDYSGQALLSPSLFITDSDVCSGPFSMTITSSNSEVITGNTINCSHVGQTFIVKVTDDASQASCWSEVTISDNSPPKILNCLDQTVLCTTSLDVSEIGKPDFADNCGNSISSYFEDVITESPCNEDFVKTINRTWFAYDDQGNHAIPCTQIIQFEAVSLTDIDLPNNITVDCATPDISPAITGFPNIDNLPINTLICQYFVDFEDLVTPTCGNSKHIFRTWKITDWCTNDVLIHNQTIEVVDSLAPVITCPDTLKYFITAQHDCTADVSNIALEVTDNCNDFNIQYDWDFANNSQEVPLGIFPVTAIVTDDCNNTSTCEFIIQTIDNSDPIAICETNVQISLGPTGSFTLFADALNNSSSDNCSETDFLVSFSNIFTDSIILNCDFLDSTVAVTLMTSDEAGNNSMCSSLLTVIDHALPEIECPDDITIKCFENALDLSLTGAAIATDNCQDLTPTFEDVSNLDLCNAGIIERTFSVFENGTIISCTQLITLEIDTPSVTFPADITVNCGEKNDLTITGEPMIEAMCPGFHVGKIDQFIESGSCIRVTNRTWKVLDHCLDSLYVFEQEITEIDTIFPVLIMAAQSVTIDCGGGGIDSLQNWLSNNGGAIATDNCVDVKWSNNFNEFNFDCGLTGSTSVTFTAADDCGNAVATTADFLIIDTIPPVFTSLPISIDIQCETNITQTINDYIAVNGNAIAIDNCGDLDVVSVVVGDVPVNCDVFEILTTATDACGLSTSVSSTLTIIDEVAPTFQFEASNISISCDSEAIETQITNWIETNGGAVAIDNCGDVTWTNDFELMATSCGTPIFATFTATDDCGNSTQTTAAYTIFDDENPVVVSDAIDVIFECDGNGNIDDINDFLTNAGFSEITDNCSTLSITNDFANIDNICAATGTQIVTFTATDICGNFVTTQSSITIVDTTPPLVIIPAQELIVECDGFGNVVEFNNWVQANANVAVEDICGEIGFVFDFDALNSDCGNTGSVFTLFGAIDECGNRTNVPTHFIIEDTTPPMVNCPADFTQADEDMDCEEFIILPPTTSIDRCNGILFFSYEIDYDSDGTIDIADDGPNASGDYSVGIHTVNYFVADECGNIGTCQQIIEITDGAGTTAECLDEFLLELDESGMAILTPQTLGAPMSSCSNITASISQSVFTCDDCGINEVILTIVDEAGNESSCATNVFVCDLTGDCETECSSCNGLAVGGTLKTESELPIPEIGINVSLDNSPDIETNNEGSYFFEGVANSSFSITPFKNDFPLDGVTTLDLIAIQKHILGIELLSTPYQMIAADANSSNSITTLDVVDIQRLILQVTDHFTNNTSWRFVDKSFIFPNYNNPFTSAFPETIAINGLANSKIDNDFVAVKIGDINLSFNPLINDGTNRNTTTIPLKINDTIVDKNEVIEIPIYAQTSFRSEGYQFALQFDPKKLDFIEVAECSLDNLSRANFGLSRNADGLIFTNWIAPASANLIAENSPLFTLKFKAKKSTSLSEAINLLDDILDNQVYTLDENLNKEISKFVLAFENINTAIPITGNDQVILYQNFPNPFDETTKIQFYLPTTQTAVINIFDAAGRLVWKKDALFLAGENEVTIQKGDLKSEGIYMCSLNTASGNALIKLIRIAKL